MLVGRIGCAWELDRYAMDRTPILDQGIGVDHHDRTIGTSFLVVEHCFCIVSLCITRNHNHSVDNE
jgi:hypothetical protein